MTPTSYPPTVFGSWTRSQGLDNRWTSAGFGGEATGIMRAAGEIFSEYRYVTVKFGQFLVPFPPRSDRRCNKIKMGVAPLPL